MKLNTKKYIFLIYTILFAILCTIVFYPFYHHHLSFIWGSTGQDGLSQHFASLVYWGEYIRQFFSNIFHGSFHLPMWDNSIGYGSDILSSLNYYAIGDPLNLIYAFSNKHNAEYFYNFMIIFRAYLAGISFILFGCYLKKNPHGILIGSLTYVFSGVFLNSGIRHPFFLNPLIYLPLLIMGIEKIYRKERPYLFMIMVTISAISNFYFFYMLTVAAVLYALIRFPAYKENGFFKTLFYFSGWYLLGLGLSMIILLPVLFGFMGNARSASGMNYFNIFLYQKAYYSAIIKESIGYSPVSWATALNFIALAYCASIALLLKRSKKYIPYKVSLILSVACVLFPILGYVMHAFSYPMNRWSFILALVIASILTEVYDDLFQLTLLQSIGIFLGIIFYYIIYKRFSIGESGVKYALAVLILTAIVLLCVNMIPWFKKFHLNHMLLYGLTFLSIGISGFGHYSGRMTSVSKKYVPSGTAYRILCDKETSILHSAKVKNDRLSRVESINSKVPNWGIVDHIPTTTNYFSITDKNVSDTLMDFGLTQYQYKFKFRKLDLRNNLMNLYHVKYIIEKKDSHKKLPVDYKQIKVNKESKLYENKNLLPFGYSYSTSMTESDFKKLNPAQKEDAMLQNAIVSDDTSSFTQKSSYSSATTTKDIGNNYTITKKSLKKKLIQIKIPAKYITDHSYLYLQDVRTTPFNSGRNHILYSGKNNTYFFLTIAQHKFILYNTEAGSSYDTGKRNYLIDIDHSKLDRSKNATLTLTFKRPNHYTIGKISIIQVNDKLQAKNLTSLKNAPHLTNISYDGANHFSGNISTDEKRILCIPIAHSRGWKVTDNGKAVKLLKVNGMFCGVSLDPGKHHIRLDYTTPGLKAGACISLLCLIILSGLMIYHKKLQSSK